MDEHSFFKGRNMIISYLYSLKICHFFPSLIIKIFFIIKKQRLIIIFNCLITTVENLKLIAYMLLRHLSIVFELLLYSYRDARGQSFKYRTSYRIYDIHSLGLYVICKI